MLLEEAYEVPNFSALQKRRFYTTGHSIPFMFKNHKNVTRFPPAIIKLPKTTQTMKYDPMIPGAQPYRCDHQAEKAARKCTNAAILQESLKLK